MNVNEVSLFCDTCNDRFTSNIELTEHVEKHHTESRNLHIPNDVQISITCKFCEKAFSTKIDLMIHKKKEHVETIEQCWDFSAGKCILGRRTVGSVIILLRILPRIVLSATFVKKACQVCLNY